MPRSVADGTANNRALAMISPSSGQARLWLAMLATAAYLTSFVGTFQFDDWAVIVDEERVHSLAAWWASMPGIRPVLKLSYALNWQSGLGLAGFHAVNLAIHLANTLLTCALLGRLAAPPPAAFVAALVFALHPVQTEAVTYVSGRSASLAAAFALASLLAWQAARDPALGVSRRALAWVASLALFLLALGTRETVFVVPAALVLLALCDAQRPARWRAALLAALPHGLVLIAAGLAAATLPRYWMLLESSFTARDLGVNLFTQLHAIAYLIGQLLMPWRLNADPVLPLVTAWTPATMALALAYASAISFALGSLRRRPAISLGILWFFLWLAPTNSLLPRLDLVNDRQLYVAIIGPAWLIGCAAAWLMERARAVHRMAARGLAVAAIALLACLGTLTTQRNLVYASEIAFWSDVAAKSPTNARAAGNLGYALALAGRTAEAEAELRRALALDPQYTRAAINLLLLKDGALIQ